MGGRIHALRQASGGREVAIRQEEKRGGGVTNGGRERRAMRENLQGKEG